MDNVLNLVYDDWPTGNTFPNANRPKQNHILKIKNDSNSPWMESYITMRIFKDVNVENYKINDIFKFPNKKFFYHVWHRTPLGYDYFDKNILPIDSIIVDLIKNSKNLDLIFMNEVEVDSKNSLKKLNSLLLSLSIDPSRVWVINNNQKLNDWKQELNIDVNLHSFKL